MALTYARMYVLCRPDILLRLEANRKDVALPIIADKCRRLWYANRMSLNTNVIRYMSLHLNALNIAVTSDYWQVFP